jgi:hypothetical protein
MVTIELTKGYEAVVDDADADLAELKWTAKEGDGRVYAYRKARDNGKRKNILMHRVILERELNRKLLPFPKEQADHIEGIGLDNRRGNLRVASNAQNQSNRSKTKNNTSGFKGVYWNKRDKKWYAQIRVNYEYFYLGSFTDPLLAANAYDAAALEHHGEFANANFS